MTQALLPGTLYIMVLRTLAGGPLHGYAIARRIKDASRGGLEIEDGSLYPAASGRSFVTPVSIPVEALDGMNRYYVVCTRDRAIPLTLQRRMAAENVCDDVVALDTDHTPHLSKTGELAEALHRFAMHSFPLTL